MSYRGISKTPRGIIVYTDEELNWFARLYRRFRYRWWIIRCGLKKIVGVD